ncbi:UNVERIFIED_CONTAM: hypothetical protein K2H54_058200 [Gekko kuhli]
MHCMSTEAYFQDGMDLGSDACSSRSSSESSSSKVTPCSECKSSPSPTSLDLAALEDSEEEEEEEEGEDFQVYRRKVIDVWEAEGDYARCYAKLPPARRSLAPEPEEARSPSLAAPTMPPPAPNGNPPAHHHHHHHPPHHPLDLRHNANVVPSGRRTGRRGGRDSSKAPHLQKAPPGSGVGKLGNGGPLVAFHPWEHSTAGTVSREPEAQVPVPTMDWEALEKHLAGLQCQEQEIRNQSQKSNYTSMSLWMLAGEGIVSVHAREESFSERILACFFVQQKDLTRP